MRASITYHLLVQSSQPPTWCSTPRLVCWEIVFSNFRISLYIFLAMVWDIQSLEFLPQPSKQHQEQGPSKSKPSSVFWVRIVESRQKGYVKFRVLNRSMKFIKVHRMVDGPSRRCLFFRRTHEIFPNFNFNEIKQGPTLKFIRSSFAEQFCGTWTVVPNGTTTIEKVCIFSSCEENHSRQQPPSLERRNKDDDSNFLHYYFSPLSTQNRSL